MNGLLNDFYTFGLSAKYGYPAAMLGATSTVTRLECLKGACPRVCPYCDTLLQNVEVDHFLPKSSFPFLSVHPDNFVPSCHDSNEFTHKGDRVPLDWDEGDQAAKHFHPRLRSAQGRYRLSFRDLGQRLVLSLVATDATEQSRVDNLDAMFRIAEHFWGRALETQVQEVVEEVAELIALGEIAADDGSVRHYLRVRAAGFRRYVGKRSRQIFYAELYEFVAQDDKLIGNPLSRP